MSQEQPQSRESIRNAWQWRVDRNPYLHNAFTFLRLNDPAAPDRDFVAAVRQLQEQIARGDAPAIVGIAPTEADLAFVRHLQKDTNLLSQEQLLVHARHEADRSSLESFVEYFSSIDVGKADGMLPLPVVNVAPIASRLPEPTQLRMDAIAAPDLSALDVLLAPDPAEEDVLPR